MQYSYYGPAQSTAAVFDKATYVSDLCTLTDSDSTNLKSASMTISEGLITGDMLSLFADTYDSSISPTFNTGSGILTLTGTATLALYQAAIRMILFKATPSYDYRDVVNFHERKVTLTVTDVDDNVSNTAERYITISAPFRIYTQDVSSSWRGGRKNVKMLLFCSFKTLSHNFSVSQIFLEIQTGDSGGTIG